MNAITSNRGKKKGKEIEVVIVHQSYVCYWYFNKLSIFRRNTSGKLVAGTCEEILLITPKYTCVLLERWYEYASIWILES
jgi:hypothetical protein